MKNSITIFIMSLNKLLKDKKILISTFLIPFLMVIGFLLFLHSIDNNAESYDLVVYSDDAKQNISVDFKGNDISYSNNIATAKDEILKEGNRFGIIDDGEISFIYDSTTVKDSNDFNHALEVAREYNIYTQNEDAYKTYIKNKPKFSENDLSSDNQILNKKLQPLISSGIVIMLMVAIMSLANFSTELLAGEREKGSFDNLVLSGTSFREIISGKSLFLILIATMILLFIGIGFFLGLRFIFTDIVDYFTASSNIFNFIYVFIVLFIQIALIISPIFLLISSFFKKEKQATSYSSVGMIFISLISALPVFIDSNIIPMIPIVNFLPTIESSILNNFSLKYLLISTIVALVFYLIMNALITINLKRTYYNDWIKKCKKRI